MIVYMVSELDEEPNGDATRSESGYAYTDEALAKRHADAVWGGAVHPITVYDALPEHILEMEKTAKWQGK